MVLSRLQLVWSLKILRVLLLGRRHQRLSLHQQWKVLSLLFWLRLLPRAWRQRQLRVWQSHRLRAEHWFVVSGEGVVSRDDERIVVGPGSSIDIAAMLV